MSNDVRVGAWEIYIYGIHQGTHCCKFNREIEKNIYHLMHFIVTQALSNGLFLFLDYLEAAFYCCFSMKSNMFNKENCDFAGLQTNSICTFYVDKIIVGNIFYLNLCQMAIFLLIKRFRFIMKMNWIFKK